MALSISQDYKDIAEQLINKYQTTLGHIDVDQILFLGESEKSPKKYADIQLVKSPYTFITNYKFIMTVYEPKIIGFTPAQLNILVMHELMHIDSDFEKLVKHDIEDFSILLQTYGVNWDTDPNVVDPLD
jgi:hypothetical protein